MEKGRLGPMSTFVGTLSYGAFGVLACVNFRAPIDPVTIVIGLIVGIIFGAIFRNILSVLLFFLNREIRKEKGKGEISKIVKRSGIFMLPFAFMFFLASYCLGWTGAFVFFSAAAMNTGVLASTEFAKLKGKTAIQNTIATTATSTMVSYLWMFSANYIKFVPTLVKGGIAIILPMIGVK